MTAAFPTVSVKVLSLAREAARQAVVHLRRRINREVEVDSEPARDVKLVADRESEQIILDVLHQKSAYPVLSEERGWTGDADEAQTHWIVDPLDGSYNYLRHIPLCCVSIGLWRGGEPLLGVVHDIHADEVFSGIVGAGAWRGNRRVLRPSAVTSSASAVLCTGFPAGTDFSNEALAEYVGRVRAYKKIRLLGSAALSLAYVAAGRADAYYERDIKVWDVAAGVALVLAAGGAVEYTPVDPRNNGLNVGASNGRLPVAIL